MSITEQSEGSNTPERSEGREQGTEQSSVTKFSERRSGRSSEQLIQEFYSCFQRRDWQGMQACYAPGVFFYDPVFENLEGEEAKGMWEMLLKGSRDLQVEFSDIKTDDDGYGSCHWVAIYTFRPTGRRVVNKVVANFRFQDGKIAEHQDIFDIWKWSRQALGIPGILFGWTPPMQKKIRALARKNLDKFLSLNYPPGPGSSETGSPSTPPDHPVDTNR